MKLVSGIAFVAALCLLAAGPLGAAVIYVSPTGTGDGSAPGAPANLQAALDVARVNGESDTLRLATGVYDASAAGANTFEFDAGLPGSDGLPVLLMGGWSATYDDEVDDYTATVLDGGDTARVLRVRADAAGAGATVTLENLTVSSGKTTSENGAGVYATQSLGGSVTLEASSCLFSDNLALGAGGAISAQGTLRLYSCVFTANVARDSVGGAIHAEGPLTVETTDISFSQAYSGGAVYLTPTATPARIFRSGFWDNSIRHSPNLYGWQGCTIFSSSPDLTIDECEIRGMTDASLVGAGSPLYLHTGGFVSVRNTAFRNSTNIYWGSAIGLWNAGADIYNCLFANNRSGAPPTYDGRSAVTYFNQNGGAAETIRIVNSTFVGNRSATDYEGDLSLNGGNVTVVNSIFDDTTASSIGCYGGCAGTIDYSAVERGAAGVSGLAYGTHNTTDAPSFQPADPDYKLNYDSPLIDRGDNGAVPDWMDWDFKGAIRVFANRNREVPIVDLGWDEYIDWTLNLTAPVAGATWRNDGVPKSITWYCNNIGGNVNLALWKGPDKGTAVKILDINFEDPVRCDAQSYTWTIPAGLADGDDYAVVISPSLYTQVERAAAPIRILTLPDPFPGQHWWRSYHGGFGDDLGIGVAIDSQRNVVLAGYRGTEPPGSSTGQGVNAYLRRYDRRGSLACELEVMGPPPGPSCSPNDTFQDVEVDAQDNVIVAGYIGSDYSTGYCTGAYLNTYDTACAPVWPAAEIYQYPGDSAWQSFYSLDLDNSGNIYPTGNAFVGWDDGQYKWATFKYSAAGSLQGGFPILYDFSPSISYPDLSYDVAVDSLGNIIVAGARGLWNGVLSTPDNDWHVRKYDATGALVWSDTFSGAASLNDIAYRVTVDGDDNPIVAGYTNKGTNNGAGADYDWLVIKYAAAAAPGPGNTAERLWTKTYESAAGKSETAHSIALDANGDVIVAGIRRVDADTYHMRLALFDSADGSEIGERIVADPANVVPVRLDWRAGSLAVGGYIARTASPYCDMYVALLAPPDAVSSVRANPNPTALASVNFTVTFTGAVTGVDATDFTLAATGVTGAAVTGVSGAGATRTVTVATGTGNGTLRLDLLDDDTIVDAAGNPLGGVGAGNGSFSGGEAYTVSKPVTRTFLSVGALDGWILESSETSGMGGTMNATQSTLAVGDDAGNRQRVGILHFDTSSLPNTAVVTAATLKIRKQGLTGTSPFTTHGGLLADVRTRFFGAAAALAAADFQAPASKTAVASFGKTAVGGWHSAVVSSVGRLAISRTSTTQFRLRFGKDDNNDLGEDCLRFYSGNAATTMRPQLIVQYTTP